MNYSSFFYSGVSGLVLPINKSQYPPEFQNKSRLEYYSSIFNSIEINSCFYKNPRVATVERWAQSVPSSFRFTFKLSKSVTHTKNLEFNEDDVEAFIKIIHHAADKKGCLLVQFPPSLTIDSLNKLQQLLRTVNFFNEGFNVCVEFRNSSWYETETYEILKEYGATMVLQDLHASASPWADQWGNSIYVRFHGPNGGYRGSYDESFLVSKAQQIKEWIKEKKTVYCYFNNTAGDAVNNLTTLNRLVLD